MPDPHPSFVPLMLLSGCGLLIVGVGTLLLRRRLGHVLKYVLPAYTFGGMTIVLMNDGVFSPWLRIWLMLFVATLCVNVTRFGPRSRELGPSTILALSAWFAVATTLLDNGWRAIRWLIFDPMVSLNCDSYLAPLRTEVFWLLPLSHFAAFFLVGSVLAVIAWRWPSAMPARTVMFCLAFLVGLSLGNYLLFFLGPVAMVLFAAVFAAGAMREAARQLERFLWFAKRSLPWGGAVIAGLAIAVPLGELAWKRQSLASLPAARPEAPNLILITLDTVRPQNLSLCGYGRPTSSKLERFAQDGVLFDRAIAVAPWTLPTHATLMTGRFPFEHRADLDKSLDRTYPTLAERLQEHGYETAGFVANYDICGMHTGLGRGFMHYEDHKGAWHGVFRQVTPLAALIYFGDLDTRVTAEDINRKFLGWLDRREDRPFFAFLNYYDAHAPYFVPDPAFDRFSDLDEVAKARYHRLWFHDFETESVSRRNDPVEREHAVDMYDASIAYLDHHVGKLLEELDRRGMLSNTVVVITNDHGEHLGERGIFNHGQHLYRQEIESPILLLGPSLSARGRRYSDPVSLVDVPATMIDLLGLSEEISFPGHSLASYWQDQAPTRPSRSYSQLGQLPSAMVSVSLVAEGMHYIRWGDSGREELYDFETDPEEYVDLAQTERGQRALPYFRQRITELHPRPASSQSQSAEGGVLRLARSLMYLTTNSASHRCCARSRFGFHP